VNTVIISAINSTFCPKATFNSKAKPYWDSKVKESHAEARTLRRIWTQAGRPRGREAVAYAEYKKAKRNFRRIQRRKVMEHENRYIDQLDRAAEIDYIRFGPLLRKRNGD